MFIKIYGTFSFGLYHFIIIAALCEAQIRLLLMLLKMAHYTKNWYMASNTDLINI